MQNLSNIIVEKSELKIYSGFGYNFDIPSNYVIYFEKEQNKELSLYIRKNHEELKAQFASIKLNFIYTPFLTQSIGNIEKLIEYYLPQLNYYQIPHEVSKMFSEKTLSQTLRNAADNMTELIEKQMDKENFIPSPVNSDELLNILDYKGEINSGLLYFNRNSGVVGVSDLFYSNSNLDYALFFEDVLFYLKTKQDDNSVDSFLPVLEPEQLDEDAKEVIKEIGNRLAELKDTGQLLFLIPILKDLLHKQSEKIDFTSISKMEIDEQNKIQLLYFKKEVELSHLTKSIYFLFLKYPKGINLKELNNYKKELLSIYTLVSNQLDYDKMAKSIDDVINLETKAIYIHLSRIKSAFHQIMDVSFAKYYIVSGSGEEERRVLFNTNDIIWNNYERFNPDNF